MGPLIRPAEVKRVKQWVDEAVEAGAKVLCGARELESSLGQGGERRYELPLDGQLHAGCHLVGAAQAQQKAMVAHLDGLKMAVLAGCW